MSLPEIQSLLSSQLPDKNYKLQVAVNSLIAKKTTASQFQEIANQFQKDSFSSFFIDAIWLQDQLGIDQFYLVNIVKSLLPRLNINHLRVRLEPELLDKLKLLDVDLTSFRKRQVRLNTSLLYRQQKFNLLREESEGYSKLIVTLISFSPSTLDNVMSLIGYFNLDSNRVLDIILDVLIVNFIDHWRFILDLLIKSPWFSNNSSKTTCSQLLGFKFSHYNNPEITIVAPPQLYWVAALLIKRNMVLLEDLYPYLYPLDENIDKLYAEFNDKCKSECNVCKFSMDFSDSSKPPDATPVIKLKENQKAHLVSALIGLGVIQKAQRILNRLPQLVEIHSDIAENVCKCLHVILDPIYSTIRPSIETLPVPSRDTFPEAQPINKHVLFQNQVFNARDGLFYSKVKFFCDEWSDGLPSANTLDSAFLNIKLLLSYVGTYLFKDLFLFNKIIRIGRAHVLAVYSFNLES